MEQPSLSFLLLYFQVSYGKSPQMIRPPRELVEPWEFLWPGIPLLFFAPSFSCGISSCRWETRWPQLAVSPVGLKFTYHRWICDCARKTCVSVWDAVPLWVCMSFLIVRNSSRMACKVLLQLHMQQLDSVVMLAGAWGRAESEGRAHTLFCERHTLSNSDARTLDNGLVTWLCVCVGVSQKEKCLDSLDGILNYTAAGSAIKSLCYLILHLVCIKLVVQCFCSLNFTHLTTSCWLLNAHCDLM